MSGMRVLLALAALVAIALFYMARGVKGALAPLCAVGSVALCLTLFGTLGLLRVGGWVVYGLAAIAVGYLVWRRVAKKKPMPVPDFGFWFFVAAGCLSVGLLWARQVMFITWDEFSLWGTAGKLMKLYDELYTTAPVGWAWTASQTPVMMVLSYFTQFFGKGFVEWQSYAASNFYQFAALAAVLAPLQKKRQWTAAGTAAVVLVLVPYVFTHYGFVNRISAVYMDTLADIPMGLAFGAALACWYGGGREKLSGMVPVCIALATLTLTKDIGLVLALVAVVIMFADALLGVREDGGRLRRNAKGAFARLGLGAFAVALPFAWWNFIYLAGVAGANRAEDAGGKLGLALQEIPFVFLKELFSADKSELFRTVSGGMVRLFFTPRNTLLGSGVVVAAGIVGMLALAAVLGKNRGHRRRCLVYGILSVLGLVAFNLVVLMSYLYVMRPEQALAFESYERYIYPYYIGWFLGALALLLQSLATAPARRQALCKGAVLLMAAVLFARVGQMVPVRHTLLGVHHDDYSQRREYSAMVQRLCSQLDPAGKTFIVKSDDDGLGWFIYCYEMLPWQVDYSFGGGSLFVRTQMPDGTTHKQEVEAEELGAHLADTGCTTVYIDNADEAFVQRYGSLFEDGMRAYLEGETRLYEVVEGPAGGVSLRPVMSFVDPWQLPA